MTFTKEQLIEEAKQAIKGCRRLLRMSPGVEAHRISLRLAEITLAALTAEPVAVVPDIGEIRIGRLPTMNQDDYPGLGDWWVQLRIGKDSDEVLARVYGATPQEANSRAEALACRAAMLQGAAGNSPAILDGYALVPVELTGAMTNAMTDAILDDLHNVDVWRSVLSAAPQQEAK